MRVPCDNATVTHFKKKTVVSVDMVAVHHSSHDVCLCGIWKRSLILHSAYSEWWSQKRVFSNAAAQVSGLSFPQRGTDPRRRAVINQSSFWYRDYGAEAQGSASGQLCVVFVFPALAVLMRSDQCELRDTSKRSAVRATREVGLIEYAVTFISQQGTATVSMPQHLFLPQAGRVKSLPRSIKLFNGQTICLTFQKQTDRRLKYKSFEWKEVVGENRFLMTKSWDILFELQTSKWRIMHLLLYLVNFRLV